MLLVLIGLTAKEVIIEHEKMASSLFFWEQKWRTLQPGRKLGDLMVHLFAHLHSKHWSVRSVCPNPPAFQTGRSNWQFIQCLTELVNISLREGTFSSSFKNVIACLTAQILSLKYIDCCCYPASNPLVLSTVIKKSAKGQLVNHWTEVKWGLKCELLLHGFRTLHLSGTGQTAKWDTNDHEALLTSLTCHDPFTSPMEAVYKIFFSIMLRTSILSSLLLRTVNIKHSWKSNCQGRRWTSKSHFLRVCRFFLNLKFSI